MKRIRFFDKRIAFIAAASLSASWAHSQVRERLGTSQTIAEALTRSGFDRALAAPSAPDIHRELTSSEFGTAADTFVAAYYFADQTVGAGLGPLHVSLFEKGSWIHATEVPEPAGAVLDVRISGRYVVINTHRTPSAGSGLVFERAGLKLRGVLPGFDLEPMPGPLVRFTHNMVHFAPTHPERLMVFDPESGNTTEVFPGTRESRLAAEFRRAIRAAYARLSAAIRDEYEKSVYGPIDDFDRSFVRVAHRSDGRRIALVVSYGSRLPDEVERPRLQTLVSCQRGSARSWRCDEYDIETYAKSLGTSIQRTQDGGLVLEALSTLLDAVLERE